MCTTFRNISNGASNIASTSAVFGAGMKEFLSGRIPITGTTIIPFCT